MKRCRASGFLLSLAIVAVMASGCGEPAGPPALVSSSGAALTQDEVLPTGPACSPTGAHAKHAFTSCGTCHVCGGVLQFSPTGPAVAAGLSLPAFDATAKTCSSVGCHAVPTGTYGYWFPDGDGSPAWNEVTYGGTPAATTPDWYLAGGATCTGCHGNPPSDYQWHGHHGGGNQCELCHPDAVSVNGVATGLSTATNCGPNRTYGSCAALHRDGVLQVWPRFRSTCYGCH